MEKIDKQGAQQISAAVQKALDAVAAEFGLEVEVRGGTFDAGSFKPRVEFKTSGADAAEVAQYANLFGLPADAHGREFTSKGRRFRVSGIAPRSSVRPILAVEIATDRTFKFPSEAVAAALAKEAS